MPRKKFPELPRKSLRPMRPMPLCLHEVVEDYGSSRRCAVCQEYLGPVTDPDPEPDVPRVPASALTERNELPGEEHIGAGASPSRGRRRDSERPAEPAAAPAAPAPFRQRMAAERTGITHKFDIAGHEGYLTVGLYADGTVGEIFLRMSKQGSTVGGLVDAWATCFSMCLQYGVPLSKLCDKFSHWSFEPAGFTGNELVPQARSVIDYVSRWLAAKYVKQEG